MRKWVLGGLVLALSASFGLARADDDNWKDRERARERARREEQRREQYYRTHPNAYPPNGYNPNYSGTYPNGPNGGYYPNGRYNGYPNGGYNGRGVYNLGYQDGLMEGQRDARTGHSYRPTQNDSYKHADRGYSSSYGNKNAYKDTYRQGYMQGYSQGYRSNGYGPGYGGYGRRY